MSRYVKWFEKVEIFATERVATEKDNAYICDENMVDCIDFKLVKKKNSISHILNSSKKLKQAISDTDCIVIRMSIYGIIAAYYARKYKKPYIIEMVACPWDSLWYHSLKGKLLAPFMTIITKRTIRRAENVLYVTDSFLQRRYPTKGKSIGCSDVELSVTSQGILEKKVKKIEEVLIKNKAIT